MEIAFTQKNAKEYYCECCDYKCGNKYDYGRHLSTRKHSVSVSGNQMEIKKTHFGCKCGKEYKTLSGLWKHKNTCSHINNDVNNTNVNTNILEPTNNEIIEIMKIQMIENQELRKLMLEQQKQILELTSKTNLTHNISNNTISNNMINSNNKTFNLQFFLNETCKDALNIGEFVDSIKIQLSDLETIGRIGYVEGVSKILIKNLNELDTCKRPIHCSDLKREVIYIKDDDKWLKENEEKLVIKKAIKDVANKNIRQIPEWMRKNPNCGNSESNKNDQYLNIVMNSMSGGSNEEQHNNIEKIVKNITKSVIIEK
jgi:hypothetical protein